MSCSVSFREYPCSHFLPLKITVYSITCKWFNSWGCHHWCSEDMIVFLCVNKQGMFGQGQSFGRNVLLNCSDCRWHRLSPGSSRMLLHFGSVHLERDTCCTEIYVEVSVRKWLCAQMLTNTLPNQFLMITFQMKKAASPQWADAVEKRASTGDQRGIDRVCCS